MRSSDSLRALKQRDRAFNIDPPTSSYAIMRRARPYRGENSGPGKAAGREGAQDRKTKELIAIATRCDGCIGFHMEALVRLGATRQEVEETHGMTI